MKKFFSILITLFLFVNISFAQSTGNAGNWDKLMGEWTGTGNGNPGTGSGKFSFEYNLDKKIIVRKNHSEYPASGDKAAVIHDDLMIIYADESGSYNKAIYFDNEGHVINYTVNFPSENIVEMQSEPQISTPMFRLTYKIEGESGTVKFEVAPPGSSEFKTYLEGNIKRIK